MKIVFTIKSINLGGGSERSTISLANALVAQGDEVVIISFTGSNTKPFFGIDSRISLFYLAPQHDPYPVIVREIRRIKRLRVLYRQLRPDVIVVIGTTRAFVNIPSTRGYKVVHKEYFTVSHRSQLTSCFSRHLTARYSDAVVVLSDYDADVYRKHWHTEYVRKIPNLLTFSQPAPSALQNKVVVAVGRQTPVKGFDLLLDAWRQVKHTDWELHIVGDGKEHKHLLELAEQYQLRNVVFYPATPNVLPFYQEASLFVLPSRSEAFGNVLTEAMSVGLPAVCFDCGAGVREILQEGVTGILVPPKDTKEMAIALDRLMSNKSLRHNMSAAALERIKCFQTDTIVGAWHRLFEDIQNTSND
ncbi:MAG TPA: hypothetical protein DIW30_07160 [Bacteroidales bacterium]|nr:hypothetical protein [Bacteroidales bacterium]